MLRFRFLPDSRQSFRCENAVGFIRVPGCITFIWSLVHACCNSSPSCFFSQSPLKQGGICPIVFGYILVSLGLYVHILGWNWLCQHCRVSLYAHVCPVSFEGLEFGTFHFDFWSLNVAASCVLHACLLVYASNESTSLHFCFHSLLWICLHTSIMQTKLMRWVFLVHH